MGFYAFVQGIFPTHGLNLRLLCLLHWHAGSLPLIPTGKPVKCVQNVNIIKSCFHEMVYIFLRGLLHGWVWNTNSQKLHRSHIQERVCTCTWYCRPQKEMPRVEFLTDHAQFNSVTQSCPTVYSIMDCSTPGLPVHHQLPEFTQTHAHWVSDAIQQYHPLSFPSPFTFNLSQRQGIFK